MNPLNWRWLGVAYEPRPHERPFLERAEVRKDDELIVRAAVLDDRESDRFFGVPLAQTRNSTGLAANPKCRDDSVPPSPR